MDTEFDSTPLPPRELRARVTGVADGDLFLGLGRRIAEDVMTVFSGTEKAFDQTGLSILDFGCGCGRVTRFLRDQAVHGSLHGVDIDPDAVRWCAENLGEWADFHEIGRRSPLPFEQDSFDAVFGVSVFTHLEEGDQLYWLDELRRVLRPGGLAMISVYGAAVVRVVGNDFVAQLDELGIVYVDDGGTEGLPRWYQSCFHTSGYIAQTWGSVLDVRTQLPAAIAGSQDAVLLQKPR